MAIVRSIWSWLVGWLHGGPHFIVGDRERPYMLRWYVLPRNPLCNVYLHKFCRDDDDRALHDHPWPSVSLLLRGSYIEELPEPGWHPDYPRRTERVLRTPGSLVFRSATHKHRIELPDGPAWTLFVTGPRVREWGFHCPRGWVHWKDFVVQSDHGQTGKGCDQ